MATGSCGEPQFRKTQERFHFLTILVHKVSNEKDFHEGRSITCPEKS